MSQIHDQPTGIVLFDKPVGWSSHRVVNFVRRATGVKRVGHTGTLDPFASGLLIVLVGRKYTKLQDSFLKQDKQYECQFELGYETTTLDSSGEVVKKCTNSVLNQMCQAKVNQVLASCGGTQEQRPPAFAAIKQNGTTLYKHALNLLHQADGVAALENWQATLPSRTITIYSIELTGYQNADPNHPHHTIHLTVSCSSGTYIRSLIRDIGEKLHTYATATALRRTSIGGYHLTQANTVETPVSNWHWLEQD